jgi:hypothetical protein
MNDIIKTMSLEDSNEYIINKLKSNDKFLISRVGVGAETHATYLDIKYKIKNIWNNSYFDLFYKISNNAGIYNLTLENLSRYTNLYNECIKNSDALATFTNTMIEEQNYFIENYKLGVLYSRVLEPFYCCKDNIKPWSHYLIGKKVLIISPFVDSFQKQLKNNFQIFKNPDKKIFLDDQEFIFYKSYNTAAGNHIHESWDVTYDIMCNDISNLEFDIALLGCGGYGLPLCHYIHKKLNKSVIYVGGGLQLLFGVMGSRWENIPMWKNIIKYNESKFIRPSQEEQLKNKEKIEGGCYW